MQIKLLGQNTSHRGPGKVYQKLANGLRFVYFKNRSQTDLKKS